MTKFSNDKISESTPWAFAEAVGIGYSGDMNPMQHGGFFYGFKDWEAYDYAAVVEFWHDPENGKLVVQLGTVHKPDDMEPAFRCSGIGAEEQSNIHAQIEACRAYGGIEPDGTDYPFLKSFDLETWRERNIWKSVRGWIEQLAQ
jgi:hypothetical protein